ncbi:HNH endonuclease [Paenibacillus amylolyticus]|uniref:HNH endonuclease n=1 Tax=Paenibacillus amylolyticus TaxID=1451 RepID=UPI00096DA9EA|nr:HNH endonuclease [Paenibacillus amylolyticus]OMF45410.1 hypothetical protein BK136_09925 [Paenibacillus amylolyticus]
MRILNKVDSMSPEDIFQSITSSKNQPCKDILLEISNKILASYKTYPQDTSELKNLSPIALSLLEKDCLKNCYSSSTVVLKWLISEIKSIQDNFNKDKCPYCGINSPSTIDHYLPKELFPEYAVMSFNLIPCCNECNTKKGEVWIDEETGERAFINFYFDEIPDEIFIKSLISMQDNGAPLIEFFIDCGKLENSSFEQVVRSHYEKLNVLSRIEHAVTTYVTEILQSNKKMLVKGLDEYALKTILQISIDNDSENHGKNYWKAVVGRAIMECDEFFQLDLKEALRIYGYGSASR